MSKWPVEVGRRHSVRMFKASFKIVYEVNVCVATTEWCAVLKYKAAVRNVLAPAPLLIFTNLKNVVSCRVTSGATPANHVFSTCRTYNAFKA